MATVAQMVDRFIEATGWPAADARNRARRLREAELLPQGPPGRFGHPQVDDRHAAAFLLGLMVSVDMVRCPEAVRRCLELERTAAREVTLVLSDLAGGDFGRVHRGDDVQTILPGGIAQLIGTFGDEERLAGLKGHLLAEIPHPCELGAFSLITSRDTFAGIIRLRFHLEEGEPHTIELWHIEPENRRAPTKADLGIAARTVTVPGVAFPILANIVRDRPERTLPWQEFGSPTVEWSDAA